jgi:small redox-active disulfide protein 2
VRKFDIFISFFIKIQSLKCNNMLTIRVLGSGCPTCNELERMCINILAEENIDADFRKINDLKEIAEYGVLQTPALIINGKVYLKGKLPVKSTLVHWIKQNVAEQV